MFIFPLIMSTGISLASGRGRQRMLRCSNMAAPFPFLLSAGNRFPPPAAASNRPLENIHPKIYIYVPRRHGNAKMRRTCSKAFDRTTSCSLALARGNVELQRWVYMNITYCLFLSNGWHCGILTEQYSNDFVYSALAEEPEEQVPVGF